MSVLQQQAIENGEVFLGIELGSTRIKSVLIDKNHLPIASGTHEWENQLEAGVWTYSLDSVWQGLQSSFRDLSNQVQREYGKPLSKVSALGVSAMMHGYLAFDEKDRLLVPFRTWRNTITGQAAEALTETLKFNIPQRWSAAHLYQAILKNEEHVPQIRFITTLAGYVHHKLTGKKVLGIGDASGMFPIDSEKNDYHRGMLRTFERLIEKHNFPFSMEQILPKVLCAGQDAGALTEQGARLLDPTGALCPGAPMCPPEGDAGTGMVATNSVRERTGNVSAGTSIFAMVVLEKALSRVYPEIDMVTTPAGSPVAMVHCNNCTSDLDAWMRLFSEMQSALGMPVDKNTLYQALYQKALEGEGDCGGLTAYNYLSGEHITGMEEGRPLFVRLPEATFTLPNFMRTLLFSAMATLKIGMDILTGQEHVHVDQLLGHGGIFKTPGVAQSLMATALDVPVTVMDTAAEGGAWGIAVLAAYLKNQGEGELLEDYLANRVFSKSAGRRMEPKKEDQPGFEAFMRRYRQGLSVEREAVCSLPSGGNAPGV